MTHLGARVSALLDGMLPPGEEERCWTHVHECYPCRDLVEHEGWVKTQLAQLSFGPAPTSHDLKSSLMGHGSTLKPAPFPAAAHRSRRGLVAIGGGAASACVVGVLALGVASSPRVEPLPPVTDLSGPAAPATPVFDRGDRLRRGQFLTPRTPLAERLVAIREKIAP